MSTAKFLYECKLCDFNNTSFALFERHLQTQHNLTAQEAYRDFVCGGVQITCKCGCGNITRSWSWKHGYSSYCRGHQETFAKAYLNKENLQRGAETRRRNYQQGKYTVWNKGLSNDTDVRIKQMHEKAAKTLTTKYQNNEIVSWQTGLTKDTDARIKKLSQTVSQQYASGQRTTWNDGLCKATDTRILNISKKLRSIALEKRFGEHSRLKHDVIQQRFEDSNFNISAQELQKYQNLRKKLHVSCSICSKEYAVSLNMLKSNFMCCDCFPNDTASRGQQEIFDFVKSLGFNDVLLSDRQVIRPKEIDVYVPSKKLGIEFNGVYWHCDRFIDAHQHDKKFNLGQKSGIQIIQIFDDEWKRKKELVQTMLKYKLGACNGEKIGARKCQIVELSDTEKSQFFNQNHLEGDVNSIKSFGLQYQNKIVAAASVNTSLALDCDEYFELNRFSVSSGIICAGAFSKLTAACLNFCKQANKQGLIASANLRYSTGNVFRQNNWEYLGKTLPQCWSTNGSKRFAVAVDDNNADLMHIYGCSSYIFIKCVDN